MLELRLNCYALISHNVVASFRFSLTVDLQLR